MPTYTLAQLAAAEGTAAIRARIVAALATAGLPTTAWPPTNAGGVENAVLDTVSGGLARFAAPLPPLALGLGLLGEAFGGVLEYQAEHFYRLTRNDATKTRQTIRLTSLPSAPPYSFSAGDLHFQSPNGNRYTSITGGDLPSGQSLFVTVEADDAGASFNDQDGKIDTAINATAMTTPFPGVSARNMAPTDFSAPKLLGSSAGTLSAVFTVAGVPPTGYTGVRVRIDASGNLGTGSFSFSVDDGISWQTGGTLAALATLPGGTSISFANAANVSPSFLVGDTWAFHVAHAIVVQGHDQESEPALRRRCRFRWPAQAEVPTAAKMTLWAQTVSPDVGKILADADPAVPNRTLVIVAGVAATVSGDTAAVVQDYINARLWGYRGLTFQETALVVPATEHQITAGAVVTVRRNELAAVQQAADKAWSSYLASVGIGEVVRLSELDQAILDAGAVEALSLTLNGAHANVALGPHEIAIAAVGTSLVTSLAWKPI